MLTKLTKKQSGFTLIELMIVIAIIGILAAIAVPQFLAFRMRSYNAAAKAVVHNIKADEANLNAELGVYGHTEAAALLLNDNIGAAAAADSGFVPGLIVAATPSQAGARLAGLRFDTIRGFAVGTALGTQMTADVQDINDTNNNSTYHAFTRHFKGDTAYALDGDIENRLYSVSNAVAFPNVAGLVATPFAPALNVAEDILGAAGNGAPTATWAVVQ